MRWVYVPYYFLYEYFLNLVSNWQVTSCSIVLLILPIILLRSKSVRYSKRAWAHPCLSQRMNIIICSWFVEYSVGVTATIRQSDGPGINDAGSKYYSHGWIIPDSVTFITALHWRLTKSNTHESAIHPYYAAVYRRSKPSLSLSRLSY